MCQKLAATGERGLQPYRELFFSRTRVPSFQNLLVFLYRACSGKLDYYVVTVHQHVKLSLVNVMMMFGCSDPHQGNLLKLPDGKLGYIDFGMVGSIDNSTRR